MPITPEKRTFGTELLLNRQKNHEFSPEARVAIIAAVEAGTPKVTIARDFNTTCATIYKILERYKETGHLTPRPRIGRPKKLTT